MLNRHLVSVLLLMGFASSAQASSLALSNEELLNAAPKVVAQEAAAPIAEVKAEAAAAPVEEVKAEAAAPVAEVKAEAVEAPIAEAKAEEAAAPVEEVKAEAAAPVAETKAEAAAPIAEAKVEAAAAPIAEVKAEAAAAPIAETKAEAVAAPVEEVKAEAAAPIAEVKAEAAAPVAETKAEAAAPIAEAKVEAAAAPIAEVKAEAAAAPEVITVDVHVPAIVTPVAQPLVADQEDAVASAMFGNMSLMIHKSMQMSAQAANILINAKMNQAQNPQMAEFAREQAVVMLDAARQMTLQVMNGPTLAKLQSNGDELQMAYIQDLAEVAIIYMDMVEQLQRLDGPKKAEK